MALNDPSVDPTRGALTKSKDLPAEVWLMALDHLGRRDLTSVCGVSRNLRALAQPLLYRFATFGRFGLHFPTAPNPFPFTDLPELHQDALSEREQRKIIEGLRRLDLKEHAVRDCDTFRTMWTQKKPLYPDVLWIELARKGRAPLFCPGDEEDDETGHWYWKLYPWKYRDSRDQRRPHPALIDAWSFDPFRDGLADCSFLDMMKPPAVMARKVVVRNAQVVRDQGDVYSDNLLPWASYAQDLVVVVNSADMSTRSAFYLPCRAFKSTYYTPHDKWSLRPTPTDNLSIETLTIVFWAGSGATTWVPPCSHYKATLKPDPQEMCCAVAKVFEALTNLLTEMNGLLKVTVVNADAITYPPTERFYGDPTPIADELDQKFRVMATLEQEIYDFLLEDPLLWVKTLSMREWIAKEEWEDVFSREEILPFLEAESARE